MRKAITERMTRETIYIYLSQTLRIERLSMRTGMNKSELIRLAIEAFLRHCGLEDPEFKLLPGDKESEKVADYRDEFMKPFVEMMGLDDRGDKK